MDKEWLKYWQELEDLEHVDKEDDDSFISASEKEKKIYLEEAKDLYKTVLNDDN